MQKRKEKADYEESLRECFENLYSISLIGSVTHRLNEGEAQRIKFILEAEDRTYAIMKSKDRNVTKSKIREEMFCDYIQKTTADSFYLDGFFKKSGELKDKESIFNERISLTLLPAMIDILKRNFGDQIYQNIILYSQLIGIISGKEAADSLHFNKEKANDLLVNLYNKYKSLEKLNNDTIIRITNGLRIKVYDEQLVFNDEATINSISKVINNLLLQKKSAFDKHKTNNFETFDRKRWEQENGRVEYDQFMIKTINSFIFSNAQNQDLNRAKFEIGLFCFEEFINELSLEEIDDYRLYLESIIDDDNERGQYLLGILSGIRQENRIYA